MKDRLPWIVLAAAAAWALSGLKPESRGDPGAAFGSLPVLQNGRVKPIDSIARTSLLQLRGKQSVPGPRGTMNASRWLLELSANPDTADTMKVFRIDDPDVLGLLGRRSDTGRYYAIEELVPGLADFEKQADRAQRIEAKLRTRFESAIVDLYHRITLYQRLKLTLRLAEGPEMGGLKALEAAMKGGDGGALLSHFRSASGFSYFRMLPPEKNDPPDAWSDLGGGMLGALRGGGLRAGMKEYSALLSSYQAEDMPRFREAFESLEGLLARRAPEGLAKARREALFNRAAPFAKGMGLYLLVFLAGCLSWLRGPWREPLRGTARFLLLAALAAHTAGLAGRMLLESRPPVTNLYSSAVFVGWMSVLLGAALERTFRTGVAAVVSAAIGFMTLLVAHHLAMAGDTLEMMQAVLDSNFWLATHVVTITMGYSAVFLAGMIAHVYVFARASDKLTKASAKSLYQMTYGVVCFALLLSFVGTVLGGIWADQSWGRFWGWDPKENGALLIVLWNAFMLHARLSGRFRERGFMVAAVFGNIVTALSWFGVNMLGIGLHSYGFMDRAAFWLVAFCAVEAAVIGLGSIPPIRLKVEERS